MKNSILNKLQSKKEKGEKCLVILLDPDKLPVAKLEKTTQQIEKLEVDYIFVGGSTVEKNLTDMFVKNLKKHTLIPIILFPGEVGQITNHADAILFLSLLSGDNPEYLIHQQVKAAPLLRKTNLEVIPTGYILIDGGKETAVQKVSNTSPIPQEDISRIINTSIAAEYLGKKLLYLEAGSGAKTSISKHIIQKVSQEIKIPLIVGGGLRTKIAIKNAWNSGADVVVIGTIFEENNSFMDS